ncbi:MAG: proteasome subunit alpha [Brevibacterium sp.]|uniref:proteasome subunit alpha n=1 Tax=Brevibacterium sp. TaxID=1701 RepID=UPI0026498381|nr:proteasome subunit alpha [Brevibacterium sp.]MDN5805639.1 proteasome subunit alpha [Brevibacterium sp.]MDN5832312.1 proteasome subunit alpha [Brevibacterium sp.]MDN5875799.1 proteasome subunit alpha [Brevibacterium sp.]MDN5909007.1 proteasome subunit alpha [Brevibacterium sp.]MDN6133012.1 proteasome subunit alpha [Brevibacterium sp.]
MSQAQFYVSPEQLMKDRADFARKGIARGRSVVVLRYDEGILLLAENPSPTLHKIAEIYDRIGFAAVGKYNEFETMRQAGVRYADLRGYSYHRSDVTARGLTNAYAQTLAGVFTTEAKPFEVELVVAELGLSSETDQLYRLSYDGSLMDETEHVAIGGQADAITATLKDLATSVLPLREVFDHGVRALAAASSGSLSTEDLEAAVLDRNASGHRTFKRLSDAMMAQLQED